jgi:hypothetical protein
MGPILVHDLAVLALANHAGGLRVVRGGEFSQQQNVGPGPHSPRQDVVAQPLQLLSDGLRGADGALVGQGSRARPPWFRYSSRDAPHLAKRRAGVGPPQSARAAGVRACRVGTGHP